MAEGKRAESWNFWAVNLSLIANCNRDPSKTKPFHFEDFHPYAKKKKHVGNRDGIIGMREAAKRNSFQ